MEDSSIAGIGRAALTQIIDTEAVILKMAGFKVGIYCNTNWFKDILDSSNLSKRYKFWLAKYGKNDGTWQNRSDDPRELGAVAWQYTSRGSVDGISGPVDMNLLY